MPDSFISQRHPLYSKHAAEWSFFMDSFNGGSDYLKADYLFSHTREPELDFAKRKERAYYYNYCEKSVELPISFVYQTDVVRSAENADVQSFLVNADRKGTSFSTLMQEQIAIPAGVYSHVLVIVDIPEDASESPSRLADVILGNHPYVSVYAPTDVLDWSQDVDGRFRWVRVRELAPETTEPTGMRGDPSYVYRTWTRDGWLLHNENGVRIGEGTHNLHEVPAVVVKVKDNKKDPIFGRSMIADIAYVNRAVFNWCSLVDEFSYEQAFPFLKLPIGKVNGNVDIVAKKLKEAGAKRLFTYDGETDGPLWVSPPTEASAFLVGQIDAASRKIAELAKMQDFSAKETNASGVAKAYDFHDQNASLAKIASNLEDAERKILRLAHKWVTDKDPSDEEVAVEYPDDFNVKALNEEIDEAIALLSMEMGAKFNAEVKKKIVSRTFPDMDGATRAKVDEEICNPDMDPAPLGVDDDADEMTDADA